ncbi:MAG TPA: SBBP repeat-containing protein, partial [Pyrinomonadaceae bacterium]|nr:SBBP repeat-containing protein [Pyrinomonadaceae bacterium]
MTLSSFLRINRVVLFIGIVCLVTTFAGVIFVAARNDEGRPSVATNPSIEGRIVDGFGRLPLSFVVNRGQHEQPVKFISNGPGYRLFLTANEAVLTLRKPQADTKVREGSVLRLKMIGANAAPQVKGHDELPGKVNYFIGNDPQKWQRNIPTYRKVYYKDVYPGIDVVYYGNQRELEYDFIVAPGANPKAIKFTVEGADQIRLDGTGNLLLNLKHGEVRLHKPLIYQLTEQGSRREVKGDYVIKGREIRFKVQAFDSGKPLVIDPVLSYSTFLGGADSEQAFGIAVDSQGSAYVTGSTDDDLFPGTFPTTAGAFKTTSQGGSAFVSKLDPTGSTLVYSTYISSNSFGRSIAVDASGNAYVTGTTTANDFPIVNGLKSSINSQDAFVTKLNSSGSGLLFSTLLGGTNEDSGSGIAVDGNGNIYVVGSTLSTNFPTINAIQSNLGPGSGCYDGFVTKIDPSAPSYVFSTYLGATGCDHATAVALDTSADVYVTGSTDSLNFPTTANAFQGTKASTIFSDAYVTKLTTSGVLVYSTYLGGATSDLSNGIAVDASGNAYVVGSTSSVNFPTLNPIQATINGAEAFVTKLNSQGSGLVYSTFLGGTGADFGRGIAVDSTGNAYVTGVTNSVEFPITAGALRTRSPIYKSIDGANNWGNDNYGFAAEAVLDIVINPIQPWILYAGTGNGVFKSTNAGRTWSPVNNGLNARRISAIVIDPLTPSTLYVAGTAASSSNNGVYKTTDGGDSWNLRKTGLANSSVISLAIDPVSPATLYAGLVGSSVHKTTNGADNWSPTTGPPSFAASLAVDPFNHTTVYAAELSSTGGVFRSTDSGATWQSVSLSQTGSNARWVGVSPLTAGLLYTQTNSGTFKSTDGGDHWSQVPSLPGFTGSIVFDPVSSSTLYFVASASSSSFINGVLKSTDNGQTWVAMNEGLNASSASALAIDPLKPSTLYVACAVGRDDAFVTKINPAGSALVYSTFLGGTSAPGFLSANAEGNGIAVDSTGNAYVTGMAFSTDFPVTPSAYQPFRRGATEVFISKLANSYLISGRVRDGSNAPVGGVEVVLTDGSSITSMTTEGDGSYEFSRLREGGNFTVSATKPHFTIAPSSQTFNNLNSDQVLDFTATTTNASFFTISGQISENGAGLPGVTVTLSGSQPGVRTTDSNGNYSFELAGGGNYTVTPSIVGFTFATASQTFNNLSAPQTANFAATRQNFVVTNVNNHGPGSLREAILNANATAGKDTVTFNIPGAGVKVIALLVSLPEITDPIVIDGTTQPGYAGSPLIELDGTLAPGDGLVIKAGGSTVKGLAIGNFIFGVGLELSNCNNNIVQGNYFGVDATGTTARKNVVGIALSGSSNNLIGGTTAAARNVVSASEFSGIAVFGTGNTVQGNFIGTNAAGTAALKNGTNGIDIPTEFTNNVIGGTLPGAGNLISGNPTGIATRASGTIIQGNLIGTDVTGTHGLSSNAIGISISGTNQLIGGTTPGAGNVISGNLVGIQLGPSGPQGNIIHGNLIGLNAPGTGPLSNLVDGIQITDSSNNTIGGTQSGAANKIAFNGGIGVRVLSGSGNAIRGNSIFSNGFLGIDLGGNGPTVNDPTDTDTGPNLLQNFPVLTSVQTSSGNTRIQGSLKSTPNTTFQIDFYSSAALDTPGNGEGALFFSTTSVNTDGNGDLTIDATIPEVLSAGRVITATATDPNGNTSEFSVGDPTAASGNVQFSLSVFQVIEDVGLATITV